ncbi:hypothetical protein VNO77_41816 [Canavalia gladiata]|uniref:Uncharacterized protein n=1 Tax=Canavalia gladiata TaxID=3824 RepID=A0AAN9K1C8_CANGL
MFDRARSIDPGLALPSWEAYEKSNIIPVQCVYWAHIGLTKGPMRVTVSERAQEKVRTVKRTLIVSCKG